MMLKRTGWRYLRGALARLGVEAFIRRDDHHYVSRVYGHRAGKHIDLRTIPEFGELAAEVLRDGRTMLYYDRLYTIYQCVTRAIERNDRPLQIAEVGVFRGGTSRFMGTLLKRAQVSDAQLHGFDTFEGHAAVDLTASNRDAQHKPGSFSATSFESVENYLSGLPVVLHKGRIQDTANAVEQTRFDFVHLDVDIYEPMSFSLEFFYPRLASGGTIVVDDYGFRTCPGTMEAVDDFVERNATVFALHLTSGQCVLWKSL